MFCFTLTITYSVEYFREKYNLYYYFHTYKCIQCVLLLLLLQLKYNYINERTDI